MYGLCASTRGAFLAEVQLQWDAMLGYLVNTMLTGAKPNDRLSTEAMAIVTGLYPGRLDWFPTSCLDKHATEIGNGLVWPQVVQEDY